MISQPETDYLYHFTPLLVVLGLGGGKVLPRHPLQERGIPLPDAPPAFKVIDPLGSDVRGRFSAKSNDLRRYEYLAPKASKKKINHLLHVQFADDTFKLVPSKTDGKYPDGQLHSVLSPRNPESTLYPNKLFSIHWVQKYLYLCPSTLLSFHELREGPEKDSQLVEYLLQLKEECNHRGTRLIAVVIADGSDEERINGMRRATGLEKRTGMFFVPRQSTELEKETFVETVCQMAYSQNLDFYTHVSKRIRKKRGSHHSNYDDTQSVASLSHLPLPAAGWEARYSFKMAVLSEFRQDLDTALQAYETAYENVLELLEIVEPDSDEWSENLELLDVIAYKLAKINFYQAQPNGAFRTFSDHLSSVGGLVKKSSGPLESSDKGRFWLANRYMRFAQLVALTQEFFFSDRKRAVAVSTPLDKLSGVELPRSGFLYLRVYELLKGNSIDGSEKLMTEALAKAAEDFAQKDAAAEVKEKEGIQLERTSAYIEYCRGDAYYATEEYYKALECYTNAAGAYRGDRWTGLLANVLEKVCECAQKTGDVKVYLPHAIELKQIKEAFEIELPDIESLVIDETGEAHLNPFKAEFNNAAAKFHVGLEARSQMVITKVCRGDWLIKQLKVVQKGAPEVKIIHDDALQGSFFEIDGDNGRANLNFSDERKQAVFELVRVPRLLGEVSLERIEAVLELKDGVEYHLTVDAGATRGSPVEWRVKGKPSQHILLDDPQQAMVLPRPSRIKIHLDGFDFKAAAGEKLDLNLVVDSGETQEIDLKLEPKIVSDNNSIEFYWIGERTGREKSDSGKEGKEEGVTMGPPLSITQKPGNQIYPFAVIVPSSGVSEITAEFHASYSIVAPQSSKKDESTEPTNEEKSTDEFTKEDESKVEESTEGADEIKDTVSFNIVVERPFRANFEVTARPHLDAWPNSFLTDTPEAVQAPRILKLWNLSASLLYIGETPVEVRGTGIEITPANPEEASCPVVSEPVFELAREQFIHNEGTKIDYEFETVRGSKEIRSVAAQAQLRIAWSRVGSDTINQFYVPPIQLNLPLYEPRAILDYEVQGEYIKLTYYIENATGHILTYAVTMGSSALFAYQGPKNVSLRVLPYTRRKLEYLLLPLLNGALLQSSDSSRMLKLPQMKIHDTFFKRTLVIVPAHGALRADKQDLFVPNPTLAAKN
ncbi:hypothetical protein TRVA0_018S01090 [Trichomonascus vanleenenianus]|uniref:uncharacterized protein n=1 Tax=Trichomonascus vanleenenianus TaxID=2268995 RepID=UPI003ECB796B